MSTALAVNEPAAIEQRDPTPMQLIQEALRQGASVDTVERLWKLQQQMLDREANVGFDEALSRIQQSIGRIKPDAENKGVRGAAFYLTYAKLDSIIRPLYTKEGFSISFGEADCPTPGKIRVIAYVSRGGITRQYLKDVTPPLLGPKGEPVMTPTHGDTSANSYARRYLMYDIFNIAVGIDKDDNDGNGMTQGNLADWIAKIDEGTTDKEVFTIWTEAMKEPTKANDFKAMTALYNARDAKLKALKKAGHQ